MKRLLDNLFFNPHPNFQYFSLMLLGAAVALLVIINVFRAGQ